MAGLILHLSNTMSSRNKAKKTAFVFIKWAHYVIWPIRSMIIVKQWLNIENSSDV